MLPARQSEAALIRTFDAEYVKSIFAHPDCYDRIRDDFTKSPEHLTPPISPHLIYLRPFEGGAVFMFHPQNVSLWSVHAGVLKSHRKNSRKYALACVDWMRANTSCRCIMALVMVGNYPAMRLIESIGFKQCGTIPKSVLVSGEMRDQRLYALEM